MRARTPASRAAHATAWPWLPALAATTPAARSSSPRNAIRLTAPRTLNEPVRWRFSAFSQRSRASSMSRNVGAVCVANPEHLLHDLAHRGQRIELAPLHLVEQPPQLGIVRDGVLEMSLRTRRRDREHLARQVAPAPPGGR